MVFAQSNKMQQNAPLPVCLVPQAFYLIVRHRYVRAYVQQRQGKSLIDNTILSMLRGIPIYSCFSCQTIGRPVADQVRELKTPCYTAHVLQKLQKAMSDVFPRCESTPWSASVSSSFAL